MNIRSHGLSDCGRLRPANEDAFFVDQAQLVFAVADGLGGLPGGADASQRIVKLLEQALSRIEPAKERIDLGELTVAIHRIVAREGMEAHPFTGAGSTLTLGQIVDCELLLAHVGDSAAYLWRGDSFQKLTTDHTMEEEFIRRRGEAGRTSMPAEYPHTLTRCVGQESELRVDQTSFSLQSKDRLLFCTDGLNKVVPADRIAAEMKAGTEPEPVCRALVDAANQLGGPDNITVVVIFID